MFRNTIVLQKKEQNTTALPLSRSISQIPPTSVKSGEGGRSTVAWYGGTLGEGHMEEDSMVFGWCRWWIMEARALLDEQVIWGMFGSVWHVVMMFKMQQDLKNPQLRKA